MTKLMEWLLFAILFFGVWLNAITGNINSVVIAEWHQTIVFLPVIALFLFGLYATITILYRVFTFNNCESASVELQQQIDEAKKDLRSKGVSLKGKIA
ncbi:PREDICTED: dolichol-phosphate mannosyltransferase subunit 3 [Dufourea novaeangliae]|uniref:Dolichol-phosphate mannosyltransferase subunit 3 n=1 Tax=Dufourea novaeangliae TaxID=178035 RepID=A0A154P8R4_DUFNO|nr:PREDICTED: dolichol-phosphate mannosyltransferase subunit 3 [Dufourea novaeangliae]KZC08316.1 Dolichol-phosphate mannosyltransferase subunit 3 [Dufourea novaeangliae]